MLLYYNDQWLTLSSKLYVVSDLKFLADDLEEIVNFFLEFLMYDWLKKK